MTKVEKALADLRKKLYDEIMANQVEGDECDQCMAYRHSAQIVLGKANAQPPTMFLKEDNE
jgi:hypothetical protein